MIIFKVCGNDCEEDDMILSGHNLHCPECDTHLTSAFLCPNCGTRFATETQIKDKAAAISRAVELRLGIKMLAKALWEYGTHKEDCLTATGFMDESGMPGSGSHCGCKFYDTIAVWGVLAKRE